MRRVVYCLLLTLMALTCNAQGSILTYPNCDLGVDIDSITVRTRLTKAQIDNLFGTNTVNYYEGLSDDAYRPGNVIDSLYLYQMYEYDGLHLDFEENGVLVGFAIYDNSHRALVRHISGGITVGDPISKLTGANMPNSTINHEQDSKVFMVWFGHTSDCCLNVYTQDGTTISSIVYKEYY